MKQLIYIAISIIFISCATNKVYYKEDTFYPENSYYYTDYTYLASGFYVSFRKINNNILIDTYFQSKSKINITDTSQIKLKFTNDNILSLNYNTNTKDYEILNTGNNVYLSFGNSYSYRYRYYNNRYGFYNPRFNYNLVVPVYSKPDILYSIHTTPEKIDSFSLTAAVRIETAKGYKDLDVYMDDSQRVLDLYNSIKNITMEEAYLSH